MTAEEAQEILDTYGIEVPSFVLTAVLELIGSRLECLELNYGPSVVTLVQAYLLSLMSVAQGGRMVTSQRAVNGASRSFQYRSTTELWRGLVPMLTSMDTKGCVTDLIPPDPSQTNFAGMWVGRSTCCMGGPR